MLSKNSGRPSAFRRFLESDLMWKFLHSPAAIISFVICAGLLLSAFFASWIAPYDPFDLTAFDLSDAFLPPAWMEGGKWQFLLGTDDLGRDIFARLVNGGKMTMTIGALSVVISTIIGILLGGIAGYFGGFPAIAIMRVAEVVSSMPFIPFAMILSAVLGSRVSVEQRMYIIMVILGLLSWPGLCRQVRAQMFAQREMEYVTAAKTIGVKENKIIFKHIIPNVMSVVLVSITLSFGTSMLTESTLSYLGFGIPAPTPTWGNMLSNANNSVIIQNYWWNWVFVGLIFGLSCVCINLIGDGLRDALDPKSNER